MPYGTATVPGGYNDSRKLLFSDHPILHLCIPSSISATHVAIPYPTRQPLPGPLIASSPNVTSFPLMQ